MNADSERIVINSVSEFHEINRAQWEEERLRYIFNRAGAEATVETCVDHRREGAPDTAWQIVSAARVASALVGPDFLLLLREVARQPTALRIAFAELSNAPGWSRRAAGGDHQELCCAVSEGQLSIALAPEQSTGLESFAPDSVLLLQGGNGLARVEKWVPDLIDHLGVREPSGRAGA